MTAQPRPRLHAQTIRRTPDPLAASANSRAEQQESTQGPVRDKATLTVSRRLDANGSCSAFSGYLTGDRRRRVRDNPTVLIDIPIRRSAADPQRSVPSNRSLSVIGHGALFVAAIGFLVAARAGRRPRTGASSSSRGQRDAHGALPKRLHAVRPLDHHIARSLTPRRAETIKIKRVGMGAATNAAADSNDDRNGDSQRPPRTRSSIASRSGVATELGDR